MNGFEPLRRRITDYTVAGQWQEVYDGPIEECEELRLKAETEKLRELVNEQRRLADAIHAYWAGGKTPEQFDALMKATARVNRLSKELGIEVD
jgi:hypothetical protein